MYASPLPCFISKMRNALFLVLVLFPSAGFSKNDLCVLNFERQEHPFTKIIDEVFLDAPIDRVKLIHQAKPLDFFKCIEENYVEIILFAHALQLDDSGEHYHLAYFQPMSQKEKVDLLKKQTEALHHEIREIQQRLAKGWIALELRQSLERRLRKLIKQLKGLEQFDLETPLTVPKPILPQIFRKSSEKLRRLRDTDGIRLKRIRLASCVPEKILESNAPLRELIEENQIQLDIAPKQLIMSLIYGKTVTTLDWLWLAESAQFDDGSSDYFFAYMNLKTLLLYRYGSVIALRGQYEIEIDGMAAGLSSKWSACFIKYADTRNMAVGEERKIPILHADFSAAFWANIELGLFPKPKIQLPSEINSLGASVGFFSVVTIRRIY